MKDPRDIITEQSFSVAPHLIGTPLAAPTRRLVALGLDGLAASALAALLGVGVLVVGAFLCFRAALRASRATAGGRIRQGTFFAAGALLTLGAFSSAVEDCGRSRRGVVDHDQVATSTAALGPEELEAIETAVGKLAKRGVLPRNATAAIDRALTEARAQTATGASVGSRRDLDRIARSLERLEKTRKREATPDWTARRYIEALMDTFGLTLGWIGIYFTVFTARWKGQTPAKRLLRIRVVRLDGKPIGLWDSFGRFSGYGAGLATGLLGFAEVFWDANRQAVQDKIASTVVIRTDLPKREVPTTQDAAREQVAGASETLPDR